MPELSGTEPALGFLAQRHDLPVILCTDFSDIAKGEKVAAIGIRAFTMEPPVRQQIAPLIRTLLNNWGKRSFLQQI